VTPLEHHHQVEDQSIWPFLRAANPAVTQLCDDLEADHEVLHVLLDEMVDTDRPLRARGRGVRDLHAELCRHLGREEGEGKPVIFDLVPASQWEEWELEVRRSTRSRVPRLAPWLIAHLTEQERAQVFASAPKLLELLHRLRWRRRSRVQHPPGVRVPARTGRRRASAGGLTSVAPALDRGS
jgi:hypothetical protein